MADGTRRWADKFKWIHNPNRGDGSCIEMGDSSQTLPIKVSARPLIYISTTTNLTAGTAKSQSVEINQNRTATGGSGTCRDWALKVNLTSTHKYPSAANAIYGSMTLVAAGVHGRAAAVQAELILPDAQLVRGTFSCFLMDMTQGASTNCGSAGPCSFFSCVGSGTLTDMDARGYLFELNGFTAGNDKLIDDAGADLTADGGIRVLLGGAVKYILYADSAENA